MAKTPVLEEVRDQLANCMKCGNCMEVCPIYKELQVESGVARGKLSLIEAVLNGQIDITAGIDKKLGLCLSCKACAAKCPCGIPADEIIIKGRQATVQARGLPPIKKAVFALLRNRVLFDTALRLSAPFQGLAFKRVPGKLAAVARFPMPGLDARRVTAPFAAQPLRQQYPEVVKVAKPQKRVGFFTGCTINYIYTDGGQAVIDVLAANGCEVVVPRLQHCCGMPTYASGDMESAKLLARHNIETFERYDLDAIVVSCGSCGNAWKNEYPEMFKDDPEMKKRAEAMAAKIYDISEFLVDVIKFRRDILGPVHATVTFHDPCHMARGLKVTRQPREIIKAIPGITIKEMKEPDRCCGAGGSFSLAHYDIARQVNDRKVKDIVATGADLVVATCGACRMHITDGLTQGGYQQDVLYPIQLLARSYAAGRQGKKAARAG